MWISFRLKTTQRLLDSSTLDMLKVVIFQHCDHEENMRFTHFFTTQSLRDGDKLTHLWILVYKHDENKLYK